MVKNILFYTITDFEIRCGGIVVQYEICKYILNLGINIKIQSPNNIHNHIFNNFYNNDFPIDDNTVVIYGETIPGNPLNAKYVIRWILAPLGICCPSDIYKTWNEPDLVYYYNLEDKFKIYPDRVGVIYKSLSLPYINPYAKNYNFKNRHGFCHTFRKQHMHKNINYVHHKSSFEITSGHTPKEYILFFNKYKFFLCYDPCSFLSIIAALCGCISIVYRVKGQSKQEWLNKYAIVSEYMKQNKLNNLYGLAYGISDINYAVETLHLVKDQWNDIINFCKTKTVIPLINDIENINDMQNNVKNNYHLPV